MVRLNNNSNNNRMELVSILIKTKGKLIENLSGS